MWRLYLAGTAAGYTLRDDRGCPPTNVTNGGRDGPRGDASSPAELCSGCGGGVCGSSSSARDTNGQISLRHGYYSCLLARSTTPPTTGYTSLVHRCMAQPARAKGIYLASYTRGCSWGWGAGYTSRGRQQVLHLRADRGPPHAGQSSLGARSKSHPPTGYTSLVQGCDA